MIPGSAEALALVGELAARAHHADRGVAGAVQRPVHRSRRFKRAECRLLQIAIFIAFAVQVI